MMPFIPKPRVRQLPTSTAITAPEGLSILDFQANTAPITIKASTPM